MLSQQLQDLEADRILIKNVLVAEPPKTVRYSLTELGYQASEVLDALTRWGHQSQVVNQQMQNNTEI
ncbi:MAG: helix-turn-helix transcriptional regulator [Leptolyngbya sp. SIO4C1]|nr:helix-turn-helix transcriptional regulator [Leptolyngbya sp. SIO4C1]